MQAEAMRKTFAPVFVAVVLGVSVIGNAIAQTYPSKPIRIIVPFPAGGSTDVAARLVAERLSRALSQTVYVENRSGANATIGIEAAVKSSPDGHTLLVATDAVTSNPYVFSTGVDPTRDLVPIVQLSHQPHVLAVHPSLGVKSLDELIALAKQQPGMRYATGSGVGSPQHMAVQWLGRIAGVKFEQVPYRGGGQAISDLIAGHVKLGMLGSTPLIPYHKSGELRLLAQTSRERSAGLPDVPTFEESGIKGLVLEQWLGVFAPAGTSPTITARLSDEITKALANPEVRKKFLDSGQEPVGGTADQFAHLVHDDSAKFARLVKELNIKAE
jgi:tripartite-type tricarboxylate transporter receptor subunit TctC